MGQEHPLIPGEIRLADTDIEINEGSAVTTLRVSNTGDRPVQVGSHIHFAEANSALKFDRMAAYGKRLDIPSGTATRFEPGQEMEVELIDFGGSRIMHGVNNLVNGPLDETDASAKIKAFEGME
ncbi:urease subunit beta [Collinsella sp. AGMB00827]|uniref:Urease subunit beta n=1 Tax=Collinsella ureilytica TaxID=2869515 RepID=A0ABS7MHN1_9ACTN|nr:urease subunit beta [Collinsella urealyticum]MBY4796863.1 urease subunit beta [Collinsella urealyticum]